MLFQFSLSTKKKNVCTFWMNLHTIAPVSICPCTLSAHAMASITKLPSGGWRAQFRRNGRYVSRTFNGRRDADE